MNEHHVYFIDVAGPDGKGPGHPLTQPFLEITRGHCRQNRHLSEISCRVLCLPFSTRQSWVSLLLCYPASRLLHVLHLVHLHTCISKVCLRLANPCRCEIPFFGGGRCHAYLSSERSLVRPITMQWKICATTAFICFFAFSSGRRRLSSGRQSSDSLRPDQLLG